MISQIHMYSPIPGKFELCPSAVPAIVCPSLHVFTVSTQENSAGKSYNIHRFIRMAMIVQLEISDKLVEVFINESRREPYLADIHIQL